MKSTTQRDSFSRIIALLIFCISSNASISQCTQSSLATSYTSNNGSRGAMFNIVAGANPVIITGFDANIYAGTTAKYEIYYRAGTYVGFETNSAAWTLVGAVNSLTSAGNNVPTYLPIPMSITIPANTTYGFYVTNTASGGLNYISSSVGNVTLASNSVLSIVGGVGKAYPFSSTYSYRLFCGTVRYYTGTLSESGTLATTSSSSAATAQNSSGSTLYSSACDALITKVLGSGASPVNGNCTARVWIESSQPAGYVKRHYEITPQTNPSTSTGTVTLYFTQQEFTDFNAVNTLKLPVDAADLANNKSNLRIEKRGGVSSNGTGLPGTYSGSVQTLVPSSVTWNAAASRWEVVVTVNGFSGFFAKSTTFALPARLLSFTVDETNGQASLKWKTADELNVKSYVVESSEDGNAFSKMIELQAAQGTHDYMTLDSRALAGTRYYRLKIVDVDGSFTYSNVISYKYKSHNVSVFPNPASQELTISHSGEIRFRYYSLTDIAGRIAFRGDLISSTTKIDISAFPTGLYTLRLWSKDGKESIEKVNIQH